MPFILRVSATASRKKSHKNRDNEGVVNKNEDKINKINKYAYQRRAIHARVKVQPFFYFLFFKLYINMSLSIRFIQNLTSTNTNKVSG